MTKLYFDKKQTCIPRKSCLTMIFLIQYFLLYKFYISTSHSLNIVRAVLVNTYRFLQISHIKCLLRKLENNLHSFGTMVYTNFHDPNKIDSPIKSDTPNKSEGNEIFKNLKNKKLKILVHKALK